jgi:transposase
MRPYSDDLRRKVLEAHDGGEGTIEDLAERFRVSYGWVAKILAAYHRTGKMERRLASRVRKRKVTAEVEGKIAGMLAARCDMTLAQIQLGLFEALDLMVSLSTIWSALGRMGFRLKKKRFTRPSGTAIGSS